MPQSTTDCFHLKAEFLPITTIQLLSHEPELLRNQLKKIIDGAPKYFENAPVIVDFNKITDLAEPVDVKSICDIFREYHIQPIAARGLKNQQELPILSATSTKQSASSSRNKVTKSTRVPTKIITKSVRAGTQIYAKDTDLLILAPVNAGAEVIADGNIHIYAPLRGRALAGASGDTEANIFCKQLDAELVSIAGHYLLNEKSELVENKNNMVQVYFENNALHIKTI